MNMLHRGYTHPRQPQQISQITRSDGLPQGGHKFERIDQYDTCTFSHPQGRFASEGASAPNADLERAKPMRIMQTCQRHRYLEHSLGVAGGSSMTDRAHTEVTFDGKSL